MGIALVGLGGLMSLAATVCSIIILIEAFKDEIWKGIVGLFCGLYLLYYGIAELDHDHKWPLVLCSLFGGGLGGLLMNVGAQMMMAR